MRDFPVQGYRGAAPPPLTLSLAPPLLRAVRSSQPLLWICLGGLWRGKDNPPPTGWSEPGNAGRKPGMGWRRRNRGGLRGSSSSFGGGTRTIPGRVAAGGARLWAKGRKAAALLLPVPRSLSKAREVRALPAGAGSRGDRRSGRGLAAGEQESRGGGLEGSSSLTFAGGRSSVCLVESRGEVGRARGVFFALRSGAGTGTRGQGRKAPLPGCDAPESFSSPALGSRAAAARATSGGSCRWPEAGDVGAGMRGAQQLRGSFGEEAAAAAAGSCPEAYLGARQGFVWVCRRAIVLRGARGRRRLISPGP